MSLIRHLFAGAVLIAMVVLSDPVTIEAVSWRQIMPFAAIAWLSGYACYNAGYINGWFDKATEKPTTGGKGGEG